MNNLFNGILQETNMVRDNINIFLSPSDVITLQITRLDWTIFRGMVFNSFRSYLTRLTDIRRDLSPYVTGESPYTIHLYDNIHFPDGRY